MIPNPKALLITLLHYKTYSRRIHFTSQAIQDNWAYKCPGLIDGLIKNVRSEPKEQVCMYSGDKGNLLKTRKRCSHDVLRWMTVTISCEQICQLKLTILNYLSLHF